MGLFHCPVGAPAKMMEPCIGCGMCIAVRREEFLEASKKVRAYLSSKAGERIKRYKIEKIAVCGKGGSGKSTIVAMLAVSLRNFGYEVVVVDMDESNIGLPRKMGFVRQPKPLLHTRAGFMIANSNLENWWMNREGIGISDIPEDYLCIENGIALMTSGKIEDPFQGCACTMSSMMREFLIRVVLEPGQIIIVDNEAGVENFGRGLEQGVDTVIAVVEPSFDSICLAEKIKYLSEGIGIRRVRAILNKIPDSVTGQTVIRQLINKNVKYLGIVSSDAEVSRADLAGSSIMSSKALESFEEIVRLMLDEAEMNSGR